MKIDTLEIRIRKWKTKIGGIKFVELDANISLNYRPKTNVSIETNSVSNF